MKHRSMTTRELQEDIPPSEDEHALIYSERRPPTSNLPSPISKGTPAPCPGSKVAEPSDIGATHPRARNVRDSEAPWKILSLTNPLCKDHLEKSLTAAHWPIHEETKLLKYKDAEGTNSRVDKRP